MPAPFEKSPKDYIALFNAKGFYFVKGEKGFEVKSIYTDNKTSCPLSNRTGRYLKSIPDITATLKEQQPVINHLVEEGRNKLENLWAGHLMERGMYEKASFMLTSERAYPNLHPEMVGHHMDSGLWKCINQVVERKTSVHQNRLLRKGVYAISSLLGSSSKKEEEVFDGFKDEFTDFTKFNRKGMRLP